MARVPAIAMRIALATRGLAGGSLASEHARCRFGGRVAHRLVGKPAGHVVVRYAASPHDLFALRENPLPVTRHIPERLQRAVLAYGTTPEHDKVAHRNREPVPPVQIGGHVLEPHE